MQKRGKIIRNVNNVVYVLELYFFSFGNRITVIRIIMRRASPTASDSTPVLSTWQKVQQSRRATCVDSGIGGSLGLKHVIHIYTNVVL